MLPDLIEIKPLEKPVRAEITVPGSKSITNRVLILAALSAGRTDLMDALWSEDTEVMVRCLRVLGLKVESPEVADDDGNKAVSVEGGKIRDGGSQDSPLELFVGNAGTAARFLAAFVCLGKGTYLLRGVPRMHERPQDALFEALRQLGYRIDSPNNKLPAVIHGAGPRSGKCKVSIEKSSQFASALLLSAKAGGWNVTIEGENAEESPYVTMTSKLIEVYKGKGMLHVESDASSASYFWGANFLDLAYFDQSDPDKLKPLITVEPNPEYQWQVDSAFLKIFGEAFFWQGKEISRIHDLGDSIMTAIVLAPFAQHPIKFTDLGRLRVQECERVFALRTELTKCGAKLEEVGDTLTVHPSKLHGAEIETYNDHRMAMCFAILGLKVPGIRIKNPACVKKTFPNFFQKLAAAPPNGLGAVIVDARTQKVLTGDELFAE